MNVNNEKRELTYEGKLEIVNELQNLINVERPKVILEIKDAREQGDLSENAEYDAARDKQGQIEDRIKQIEDILANSIVIDPKQITQAEKEQYKKEAVKLSTKKDDESKEQLRLIEFILNNSVVVKVVSADTGSKKVRLGSTVKVKVLTGPDKGQEYEFKIVGTLEADPLEGKVSNKTPFAHAILNREEGYKTTVEADFKYDIEIVSIR